MDIFYLAVDAGGSRCRALLADSRGNLLRQSDWQNTSCSGEYGAGRSDEAVLHTVREVLRDSAGGILRCMVNFAGDLVQNTAEAAGFAVSTEHCSEYEAALALSGREYGYVCLAGTGAGAMAIRRGCENICLDGLGPNGGDFGGGYRIGRRAIEAAIKSSWSPEHYTALEKPVNMLILGREDSDFGRYYIPVMLNNPERSLIASAARIVAECAEQGDKTAQRILRNAAEELADTLRCLIIYAAPDPVRLPVICTGSVINSPLAAKYFDAVCSDILSGYEIIHVRKPQATGLLLRAAMNYMTDKEYRDFFERLQKQKEMFE